MRLAVTRTGFYPADRYCGDPRQAKRLLRELDIRELAIDFFLAGKSNGCELLEWASRNDCLPGVVVIIERDRNKRSRLAASLHKAGYRSNDQTNFRKLSSLMD